MHEKKLTDSFHRLHDYLRISLTDSCNLRCFYCMPNEDISCMPHAHLMQAHEIDRIAGLFVEWGVKKIRLTGGEPLVRKEARQIIELLAKYPVELTMTTNGIRVHEFLDTFKAAGIRSLNVSLDTLDADKFTLLTKRRDFDKVWNNIHLLLENGFRVKLNAVVMKGINDQELAGFVALTRHLPLHVRFIEFMPFTGNQWMGDKVFSFAEMLQTIAQTYEFERLADEPNGIAKKFQVPGHVGTFAVISTITAPFCHNCNRMRLTADGKMKNCLFSKGEVDLLGALRREEDLVPLIRQCLLEKAAERGGQFEEDYHALDPSRMENRSMITIGG